jgi:hypothetical protein
MRTVLRVVLLLILFTSAAAAVSPRQQGANYRREVINKRAAAGSAAAAAVGTARNSPHEWGRGPAGFAARFGSSFGQHVVKDTIQFGVAAWHRENLHYQRSNLQGTMPRMKYALKATFIVPKTDQPGHKTVALSRISGNMGAGLISRAWQPASAAGLGAGLASGGIGLGADVGVNMAREFWPRNHKQTTARYRPRAVAASQL